MQFNRLGSKPKAKSNASRASERTCGGTVPTKARRPALGTVARLSKLIAEVAFSPHSGPIITSEGMPRIVVVMGATVIV
jgi:hypothetical protein